MTKNKKDAIVATFKKSMIIVVVFYVIIVVIDSFVHPRYPGWLVALFAIVFFLVGVAYGLSIGFKTKFSSVMRKRSDAQLIREIQSSEPKRSGGRGLDDRTE
jgi:uncharacterized integral membrane protein